MSAALDRRRREEALAALAARLGTDELEVLTLLARRARLGQRRYGALEVPQDRRDFRHELLEEVIDGLFYGGRALLRERPRAATADADEDTPPAIRRATIHAAAPHVGPVPEEPQENGVRLATMHRSEREQLRVTWREWEGRPQLGLRVWRRNRHDVWFPDPRRGLAVHVAELADFLDAVATAATIARAQLLAADEWTASTSPCGRDGKGGA